MAKRKKKPKYIEGQEPYEKPPDDAPVEGPPLQLRQYGDIRPGELGQSTIAWSDGERTRARNFLIDNWDYLADLLGDIAVAWQDGRYHDKGLDELVAFLEANGWEVPPGEDQ